MDPVALATLGLLGGFLALDATGLGQIMVSRPLVSGTVAGWILGDPAAGLAVGAALELLLLPEVPFGGGGVPEGWLGGVAGAAAAVLLPGTFAGRGTAVLFGLVWALVGGWTLPLLRRWNVRLLPSADHPKPELALERAHRTTMAVDFLRGTALSVLGVLSAGLLLDVGRSIPSAGRWVEGPAVAPVAAAVLLALLAGVSSGAVMARSGRMPRGGVLFLLGIVGGAAGVVLL